MPQNKGNTNPKQNNQQLSTGSPQTRVMTSVSQSISYSGPMPHPSILREYEEVVPGSAKRIIDAFEKQGIHRQELEQKVVDSDIRASSQGRWFGFIIVLATLAVCLWLGLAGHEIVSLIGIVTGLGTLAGAFYFGSQRRVEERVKKAEIQNQMQPK